MALPVKHKCPVVFPESLLAELEVIRIAENRETRLNVITEALRHYIAQFRRENPDIMLPHGKPQELKEKL
jgi:metal-responsive CopG/Arc/MetJ family transcriptional regulator